jgi:ion channel-forming bestrophin family protein
MKRKVAKYRGCCNDNHIDNDGHDRPMTLLKIFVCNHRRQNTSLITVVSAITMCTTYFVNHGAPIVAFTPTATLSRISHQSHYSQIKSQQNQQHYWTKIHPNFCQIAQQKQKRRRNGSSIIITVSVFPQMDTFDNSTFTSVDDTVASESINNDDTVTTEFRNSNIDSDGDDDDYDEMVILQKVNGRYVATTAEDHQHMSKQERLPKNPPTIDRNSNRDPVQSQQYPNSNVYSNNASGLDRNAEYRYSVKDWLPIMCSIFQSSTLKYTRGPIIAVMMWSLLLCTMQQFSSLYINYLHRSNSILQQIYIFTTSIFPSTTIAHATTVTVLGLLLVFRTTSAYQKFDEGRLIWERILSISRNMTRQIYLYPEFYQVRSRILQLLAAYPYFLHQHVVKKTPTTAPSTTTSDISPIDSTNIQHRNRPKWLRKMFLSLKTKQPKPQTSTSRTTSPTTSTSSSRPQQLRTRRKVISNELPWSLFLQPDNAFYNRKIIQQLMYVENRPLYICDEIGKEIISVPYSHTYTSMERMVLLQLLNELTEAVSECERINHTSVPLNYARHSLRGLTIWLFTLPVSLLPTYDWWTAPIMGLTAWLYYGIYQIGYIVEDPFQRTIRLTTICDTIYRDVICTEQRSSAFDDMILSGDVDGEWKDLPL